MVGRLVATCGWVKKLIWTNLSVLNKTGCLIQMCFFVGSRKWLCLIACRIGVLKGGYETLVISGGVAYERSRFTSFLFCGCIFDYGVFIKI